MSLNVLYGFDVEGQKFSKEYVENKFRVLSGKLELLEIPVYRFVTPHGRIDRNLLSWFLDLASSYNFRFTAHAFDDIPIIFPYEPNDLEVRKIDACLRVAEEINALKIVFHQKTNEDGTMAVDPDDYSITITLENVSSTSPFKVEEIADKYGLGFTLDIPHMFLYAAEVNKEHEVYDWVEHLNPAHLHISNTYFKHASALSSLLYLLKGDLSSAFVKLRGDFHLPLSVGHINYRKIFEKLNIPETIIMEISTANYELLMRSIGKKSKIEKGYEDDIRQLKKLLKMRGIF